MLNGLVVLSGIFCVFFVVYAAPGLAELTDTEIIKEINNSERRTRDHVDKKIEELGKKFENLDKNVAVFNNGITKEVEGVSKRIDDLQGRVNLILNLIIGGIITLCLSLVLSVVGYITKPLWEERLPWRSKAKEGSVNEKAQEETESEDTKEQIPGYELLGGSQ